MLNGHTGRVNTVQWVHRDDCGQCLNRFDVIRIYVPPVLFSATANVQQRVSKMNESLFSRELL